MCLTVRDGTDVGLTGVGIYFIRTSTKRTLGWVRQSGPEHCTIMFLPFLLCSKSARPNL